MQIRQPRRRRVEEERWDVPSGRVRVPEAPPVSFQATVQRMLRARGGRHAAGRAGRGAPARNPKSRRVTIKARVIQVGREWGKKSAKLHLSYLERDGVERDGSPGSLYGANGAVERATFEQDIPGEEHQFRIIVSPEDGHELDLDDFVRRYVRRIEKDLNRKLLWAAVNHYNTDNPHSHLVIRGIDAHGGKVHLEREYVSHGLRHRAEDLATETLGERPERSRVEQLKREAGLERYTSLDRALERGAVKGIFRPATGRVGDAHLGAALRTRLDVLARLGLATRKGIGKWELAPNLRAELDAMARRAEGLQAIRAALPISANRCRVIVRAEPGATQRAELDAGVQGIVRSKGLDEDGKFCAVVETVGGLAYYLPVSAHAAAAVRKGQIVEIKRAVDKDARIAEVTSKAGGVYDLSSRPDGERQAYQARLEQLVRLGLAARELASPDRFRVRADFRAELAKGKPQQYWQLLSLRGAPQSLDGQKEYEGHVWLDTVRADRLAATGFGREVSEALAVRHAYLRGLGLDPQGKNLVFELRDLQRQKLEQSLAESRQARPTLPATGFEGTVRLHRQPNRQAFLEIRSGDRFVLVAATRNPEALDGKRGQLHVDDKGRVRVEVVERDRGPERS